MRSQKVTPRVIVDQLAAWGYQEQMEGAELEVGTLPNTPYNSTLHLYSGTGTLCGKNSSQGNRMKKVPFLQILERKRRCVKCAQGLSQGFMPISSWRSTAGILHLVGSYLTVAQEVEAVCERLRSGGPTGIRAVESHVRHIGSSIREGDLWTGLGAVVTVACEDLLARLQEARRHYRTLETGETNHLVVWRHLGLVVTDRDIRVEHSRKLTWKTRWDTAQHERTIQNQMVQMDVLHAGARTAKCGPFDTEYALVPSSLVEAILAADLPVYGLQSILMEDMEVLETTLGLYRTQGESMFTDLGSAYQAAKDIHR